MSSGSSMEVRHRDLDVSKDEKTGKVDAAKGANNGDRSYNTPLEKKLHSAREAWFTLNNMTILPSRGFADGLFVSLAMTFAGLVLQNLREEGWRVSFAYWFSLVYHDAGLYPPLLILLYLPVHLIIAFVLEKAMAHGLVTERYGLFLQGINLVCQFFCPVVGFRLLGGSLSIVCRILLCMLNITAILKVWSFVHICWWCRDGKRQAGAAKASGDSKTTEYPNNLTVGNYVHFAFAPTVCYELDYPLRPKTNWWNLTILLAMTITAVVIKWAIFDQLMAPTMKEMLGPCARGEWLVLTEMLLKLAVPFYVAFLFLNISLLWFNVSFWSELTRVADNHAYDNWWEAEDNSVYWRRWNIPIHNWCSRHVYQPLLRAGFSTAAAKNFTFFVSGVFHDYACVVPVQTCSGYLTVFFIAQASFCDFTEWLREKTGDRWGHAVCVMERALCVPLAFFMTVYHYHRVYNADDLAALANSSAH